MGTANQFRIEYNPYHQTIKYAYKSATADTWQSLDTGSPLIDNEKYQSAVLINVLDEIIPIIHNSYNFNSSGLEIVFCGTDDDFDDLQEAVKRFCDSYPDNNPIWCAKLTDEWYAPADEIIPGVEKVFSELKETFTQQGDDALHQLLANYQEAVSPIVPICVMGTYSAGKSAFINALIGHEILPSEANPLTAKVFRIAPGNTCLVHFPYNGDRVEIVLEDSEVRTSYSKGPDQVLIEFFKKVTSIKADDTVLMLSKVITVINGSNIDAIIDVELPFNNTTLPLDQIRFEIYDTPGSDSNSHQDHKEKLKQALAGRTNGLPILITEPTKLDTVGTADIVKLIEDVNALDRNNIIVVINKADDKTEESLKKLVSEKADTVIKSWKINRLIFASAAMALGSKKQTDIWNDNDCEMIFEERRSRFANPRKSFYTSLPRCNQLPEKRKVDICNKAETAQQTFEENPGDQAVALELIAHNSGIRGVESEIAYYGMRHAAYNKCRMAIAYLAKAIASTHLRVEEKSATITRLELSQQDKLKQKFEEISNALEQCRDKTINESSQNIVAYMTERVSHATNQILTTARQEVFALCEARKKDKSKELLASKLDAVFQDAIKRCTNSCVAVAEQFWKKQEAGYKDAIVQIINGSQSITEEEKEFLRRYVAEYPNPPAKKYQFNIREENLIKGGGKFLWISIKERVNATDCANAFSNTFEDKRSAVISEINKYYIDIFTVWCRNLCAALKNNAKSLSPELIELGKLIDETQQELREANNLLAKLKGADQLIGQLMLIKTTGGDRNE